MNFQQKFRYLYPQYDNLTTENIPVKNVSILVGNKLDLDDQRKIDQDDNIYLRFLSNIQKIKLVNIQLKQSSQFINEIQIQTYAVDNGMLVQEVSCISNGTNIDSLIRQISNKAKFLLKNQSKDKKPVINKSPRTFRENIMMNQKSSDKLLESTNVEAIQANRTSNVLSSQNTQSNRNSFLTNTSQVNQTMNISKITQSINKPIGKAGDVKRDSHIDKNRQSQGDNDSSVSPARKKFDVKDKLKQFTKKKDTSNEDERPLPPKPVVEQKKENDLAVTKKAIQDTKQNLIHADLTTQHKEQELQNKNELQNKFSKITQKQNEIKATENNDQSIKVSQVRDDKNQENNLQGSKIQEKEIQQPIDFSKGKGNIQTSKLEPKIQPSRSSQLKKNSIQGEIQLSQSNSRNSFSSNKQMTSSRKSIADGGDLKASVMSNKSGVYNSKDEDKRSNIGSSQQSQRSEQNNNPNQSILESMYKNKINNTNKLPPTTQQPKQLIQENKSLVKFTSDDPSEIKRKSSTNSNSNGNKLKDSQLDIKNKNNINSNTSSTTFINPKDSKDTEQKNKVSTSDLLKKLTEQEQDQSKVNMNDSQKQNHVANKQNDETDIQKSQDHKNQIDNSNNIKQVSKNEQIGNQILSQSNQQNKAEQIRKNSWRNEQNKLQQQDQVDEKDSFDEDEQENEGRKLPTPQINVLECSQSPNEKNQQINNIAQNSAEKSSNSLNEYLENENLLNKQDELLAQLVSQPISSDRKHLIDSEYVPIKAEQPKQNIQQKQEQIPKIGMFNQNVNKFVKSDYLEDRSPVNRTFNTQITNQFLENILNMPEQNQQNRLYESTVLNKQVGNNEFYRQSFEDVPNIMNPSSNDSSMVIPPKEDEIQNKENIDFKDQPILEQIKSLSKNSTKNINNNTNNQYNFPIQVNQNEQDFNSFNLKDPASVHQFSLSKQQYTPQSSQQYLQNQSIEQNLYPQQNIIQYQSFQDKQGINPQQIQQSHNNSEQQQQSQQQAIQYLYNLQTGSQMQQQNFNTNESSQQLTQQQMNQQSNQLTQSNNSKQLNQSPQIQIQDQINQFGSYVSNGSNIQTAQNLSYQQTLPQNQLEQEFLLQQLLQQMQSNQHNKQNPHTEQLIKQLLQNQQQNNPNNQQKNIYPIQNQILQQYQNQIPSQFSFSNNPLNRQLNPYDHMIQQQNGQILNQSPNNIPPFNIKLGTPGNNMQFQQNYINEQNLLKNSNGLNQNSNKYNQMNSENQNLNGNNQILNQFVPQGNFIQQYQEQGIRQIMNDNYQFPSHSLSQQKQQFDKNAEESLRISSKYNESQQDGKVSRFSIHTMNKTQDPVNSSGLNTFYLENNQQKENSILNTDVETRQSNQSGFQQRQFSPQKVNYFANSNDPNNYMKNQSPYRKDDMNIDDNFYSRTSEEGNYPQFGGKGNIDNRGRNTKPNTYYQEQYNPNFSDRQFTGRIDEERGYQQKRENTEGGCLRKSQQEVEFNKYQQARDFSNSSHIDDLLREVNNISLNKSTRRNKQDGQSTSQSQLKSYRGRVSQNQYNDTSLQQYYGQNNVNTSNILHNISSNMLEKSFDETSELTQLDKNIKALEESIEDIDIDLRQGRIQQKIKSRREYSNNQNKEMDTSAPLINVSGNGYSATQTLRSRSQNEKQSNLEQTKNKKQMLNQFASSGEEIAYLQKNKLCLKHSESNVPIYETTLLSSKKSPKKDGLHEEIQMTLGKPQSQPLTQRNGRLITKENTGIVAEINLDQFETDREDIYSMVCVDLSSDFAAHTQIHSSKPSQQNFHSKKLKPLLMLNIDYDHQKLPIDVFGNDTSFSIAERFFASLNKTASRNQIKKLSQIIERIINKYCSDLEDIVEKIEKKKLKERDTLECFIREKNYFQANHFSQKNNETNQILSTHRSILNNSTRQIQEIIGKINIDYQKKQLVLSVRENSNPHELAYNFTIQNNLPMNKLAYIIEQITQIQQIYQQKKSSELQTLRSNNPYNNLEVHFSPSHQNIGRYRGQLTTQSINSSFIGSPNRFQSPTKNDKRDKQHIFNIKFDIGNGKYIHLSVQQGDNLKKLAFDASQTYKLSHQQYLKVYECLEKTYRIKRESSWTSIYGKK